MYTLLWSPIDGINAAYDWSVYEEYASISEACAAMAEEIKADIDNNEEYAYRIIENGGVEWKNRSL